MRILLVHNEYQNVGGEERVVQELENALAARGHQVWLYRKKSGEWNGKGLIAKIKEVFQIPFSFRVFFEISQLIKRHAPDVIHVHNIFPFVTPSVYYAAAHHHVPVVQSLHNYRFACINGLLLRNNKPCELCLQGSALNGVIHRCYQKSLSKSALMATSLGLHKFLKSWQKKIDRLVATSQFSRDVFKRAGLPENKICVIPNGIDVENVEVESEISKTISLVYVGRLSLEKGIKTMLEGYAAYAESNSPPSIDIIGDGPLLSFVRAFQEKNPAWPIHVHGFVESKTRDEILSRASYLLFPSECYENCPYAVLESMAKGVPVIASRTGGIPEFVVSGESGWLFDVGSARSMVDCLAHAVNTHSNWAALSRSTRKRAFENYRTEKWLSQMEKIYHEVVHG